MRNTVHNECVTQYIANVRHSIYRIDITTHEMENGTNWRVRCQSFYSQYLEYLQFTDAPVSLYLVKFRYIRVFMCGAALSNIQDCVIDEPFLYLYSSI